MTRPFFSSVALVLALLAVLAVDSLSSGAAHALSIPAVSTPSVTVPSVTVPSVTVPSVTTPSVTTPSVTTPSVTTPSVTTPSVTAPSVSTPSVKLPSVSPPSAQAPSVSSPVVGSTPSVSASGSGILANGSGASTGGDAGSSVPSQSGSSNVAAPNSTSSSRAGAQASDGARAAKIAKLERHLKTLVTAHSLCVATLSPREQTVLQLRAGVDGPAYTGQQVARRLHLTVARETQIEQSGLIQLQQAVAGNRCGAGHIGVLEVPSGDRLVGAIPIPTGAGADDSPGATSGSAARHSRASVSAVSKSRGTDPAASPTVRTARLVGTNTPLGVWSLLIIGSIAALVLLSTAGRRLALNQERGTATSTGGDLTSSSFAPVSPAAPVALAAAPVAAAATPPAARDQAQAEEDTPGESYVEEAPPVEPAARSTVPTPAATASPERPTVESSAAGPATPPPAGKRGATQQWLHKHRSQIALALAATASVAGAVLRVVSRNRRR
jgi:hypothetical protein